MAAMATYMLIFSSFTGVFSLKGQYILLLKKYV